MAPLTDDEWMERYRSGDVSAFEELYRRHAAKVSTYFFKRTQSRAETDELTQKMFLKFHESRHLYDRRYPVLQWMYVIARSLLIDLYRKKGREIKPVYGLSVEELDAHQAAEETQDGGGVDLTALKGLTAEQQEVLQLRVLDQASYEEIAAHLEKSESAIRKVVSRALKKLRMNGKLGVGL